MMHFPDAAAWETWLSANHTGEGVWLRIAKKGAPLEAITIGQALDVALCYGWIDSQRRGHDEHSYLQRFSKRRPGSPWSRVNVRRVESLTEAGRMRPPGLAEVERARADGRWQAAYAAQSEFAVPADLEAALDPAQRTAFESLDRTARYLLVLPLLKARTPQTRAARLKKALDALRGDPPPTVEK
ncbi:YdeI/OmpD-associated family protein [Herbidospora daliensis]|uniref:YdeI/OmpD-associated family protein n=1 Tax=Herbidospora daliensis TaxID=295585 RepID=UPI0007845D8E|nr:YdeI/OmpD-associated family protein [Herbidospora daliensis]